MAGIKATIVKELRERTGLGMMDCKKALVETDGDIDAAIKLLREKGAIKSAKKSGRETNEGFIKVFVSDKADEYIILMMNCETDFVVRNDQFQNLVNEVGNELLNKKDIKTMDDIPNNINEKITQAIATIGENIKLGDFYRMKIENDNEYIDKYIHSNSKVGVLLKAKIDNPSTKDNDKFKTLIKDLCMQIAAMNVKALKKEDVDEDLIQSEKEIYLKQAKESGKPENIIEKIVEGKLNKIYSEITLMGQSFVKDDNYTVEKYVNMISNEIGDKVIPIEFVKFSVVD